MKTQVEGEGERGPKGKHERGGVVKVRGVVRDGRRQSESGRTVVS